LRCIDTDSNINDSIKDIKYQDMSFSYIQKKREIIAGLLFLYILNVPIILAVCSSIILAMCLNFYLNVEDSQAKVKFVKINKEILQFIAVNPPFLYFLISFLFSAVWLSFGIWERCAFMSILGWWLGILFSLNWDFCEEMLNILI